MMGASLPKQTVNPAMKFHFLGQIVQFYHNTAGHPALKERPALKQFLSVWISEEFFWPCQDWRLSQTLFSPDKSKNPEFFWKKHWVLGTYRENVQGKSEYITLHICATIFLALPAFRVFQYIYCFNIEIWLKTDNTEYQHVQMSNRTSFRPFQGSQNKSQADVQMMACAPKFILEKQDVSKMKTKWF